MADELGWVTIESEGDGYRTAVRTGAHALVIDEPASAGGTDAGPTPYDLLLGAIGGCTAMTVRMYARRKAWPLDRVVVRLRTARSHAVDCADCETRRVGVRRLERTIELHGALDDEQRTRLLAIADRCPVKQTLEAGLEVVAAVPDAAGMSDAAPAI